MLFAAQLGYLHSTPDGQSVNRMARITDGRYGLPELGHEKYLMDAFIASGMVAGDGSSMSWADINAFSEATNAVDDPFEKKALFDMSRSYSTELSLGADPFRIAPCLREVNDNG